MENLINEVFLRPADQRSKNYHNRILVEKNWKEMENILETESKYRFINNCKLFVFTNFYSVFLCVQTKSRKAFLII